MLNNGGHIGFHLTEKPQTVLIPTVQQFIKPKSTSD
jgi:hypothetical protein